MKERAEEGEGPPVWANVGNPDTIEAVVKNLQEGIYKRQALEGEPHLVVEKASEGETSESETALLKLLENVRQEYVNCGGRYPAPPSS